VKKIEIIIKLIEYHWKVLDTGKKITYNLVDVGDFGL
jgi:hypothetical protein